MKTGVAGATPMTADGAACEWKSKTAVIKGLTTGAGSLTVAVAALAFGAATIAI